MAEIINFLEARQFLALQEARWRIQKREDQPPPRKKALVISALPGEPLPSQYPDFRPFLQRDGLILLSWAVWKNYKDDGLHYRINWIKSCGKAMGYADFWEIKEDINNMLAGAFPDRRGDFYYREGKIGYSCDPVADTVFICAPRLNMNTRPLFIEKLKQSGVNINFDFDYNLGYAKELKFKMEMGIIKPNDVAWGGEVSV